MANKKQRALELAKTEARISGIPKGGSTRTGTSEAEGFAYQLAGTGLSAGMIGSSVKDMAKLYKLYKAEKKASKTSKLTKDEVLKLAEKLPKDWKGKAGKVSDKKLLELYRDGKKYTAIRKAHPRKSKGSGKYAPIGDLDVEYLSMKPAKNKTSKKAVIAHGTGAALAATAAVTSPNQLSKRTSGKAKGSSVKKYSRGGGVRKAQY